MLVYKHLTDTNRRVKRKQSMCTDTEFKQRPLIGSYIFVRTTSLCNSPSTRFSCIVTFLVHLRVNRTCSESVEAIQEAAWCSGLHV